jgi:hypothetical protein
MGKNARYLFNLQYNTGRVVTEQRAHLNAYTKQATLTSHAMERLGWENIILHCGTRESMEMDLELQVAYRRLGEAGHGWNFTCQQLDLAREEVDTHTHAIVQLVIAIETQDVELEERVEIIANLEQQLLELQLHAQPAPEDPDEIDAMSGVDEYLVLVMSTMRGRHFLSGLD